MILESQPLMLIAGALLMVFSMWWIYPSANDMVSDPARSDTWCCPAR